MYSFYCELKGVKSEEDVPDTSVSGSCVTPQGSSTSPCAPPVPPKTAEGNIYEDLRMHTARNNLRSDAARAEEGEVYAIYDYTLPNKNLNHFN